MNFTDVSEMTHNHIIIVNSNPQTGRYPCLNTVVNYLCDIFVMTQEEKTAFSYQKVRVLFTFIF